MSNNKRVLPFPDEIAVGEVHSGNQRVIARGTVELEGNDRVLFRLFPEAWQDLSFFQKLPADSIHELWITGVPVGDSDIHYIAHFTDIEELNLADTSVSSTGLESLPKWPLKRLSVRRTRVQGLGWLTAFPGIEVLDLSGTWVDDSSLDVLLALKSSHIKALGLADTKVTDDGVGKLCEMPNLELLMLRNCRLTNRFLYRLPQFPKIAFIDAKNVPVEHEILTAVKALDRDPPSIPLIFSDSATRIPAPGHMSPAGPGIRAQVFEVIVRQALAGAPWKQICAGPMQVNKISEKEIEDEVNRRRALMGKI